MHRLLILLLLPLLTAATLVPVASPAPAASPVRTPVSAPVFGLNSHLATRYPDPATMDVPAELLTELGVTWAREDFHWHRVQPRPAMWDWTFTDAAMRAILSRDVQVLGVLGPSVGWATPHSGDPANDVSYYAPNPDAFVQYARGVVTRYRRYVKHWEIWNEPDHPYFWRPNPDVAAYTRMLIQTAAMIREVDPEAKILLGGINPYDTTFLRGVAEYGGWNSFDILAIHPYVNPYSPEHGNLAAAADGVRALMSRYGQKPIWATEVGWASGPGDRDTGQTANEQNQADYLVRANLMLWEAGIEKIFWYTFKDDPSNPYGLVRLGSGRTDYARQHLKPAFFALRTINQQMAGVNYVERRDLFTEQVLVNFADLQNWRRTSQPNGTLRPSTRSRAYGQAAELSYSFTTRENDYVVFERNPPIPIPGQPYAIGAWLYGDGSTHGFKVWLRDAQGEVLQFVLGPVGAPGWHFIQTALGGEVEPGNVIVPVPGGNRRLDFPATLQAIVLDDMVDSFVGDGVIWIDDIRAINGHEIYDLRLVRGNEALDILWSPPGARANLATTSRTATLIDRDGNQSSLAAEQGRLRVNLGSAPVYLWHRR
ncbi:MAG: glycosyl hydrolase [Candidatus Viridilinea halotolerans]|uniref:Glycosyl hydrolase n=1 Tax=Candidatus Viridilinea halotolerans TaxID=2491704 RepID=A0A426TXC8_9CHLR|nr:MAG: glycosyl hydrolase [Candidatus Viridilinea halotolerans]